MQRNSARPRLTAIAAVPQTVRSGHPVRRAFKYKPLTKATGVIDVLNGAGMEGLNHLQHKG